MDRSYRLWFKLNTSGVEGVLFKETLGPTAKGFQQGPSGAVLQHVSQGNSKPRVAGISAGALTVLNGGCLSFRSLKTRAPQHSGDVICIRHQAGEGMKAGRTY